MFMVCSFISWHTKKIMENKTPWWEPMLKELEALSQNSPSQPYTVHDKGSLHYD